MHYFNKKGVLFGLLLLIATILVFYQFPNLPQKISFDELEFAKLALSLEGKWLLFSPLATGHATFYFYLLLLSIKTFGLNVFALRLPAAILAVLNTLLVYKLLRFNFKTKVAFLGALIFSSSHWVLNFGRYAFETTYLLFWELSALILLEEFFKTKKTKFFLGAGIATVLTFYSYLPGRIFWLLPLIMMIVNKIDIKLIVGFLVGFVLLVSPLLIVSGGYENRIQELSYLSQDLSLSKKVSFFYQNVTKNLLMLNVKGDLNGRHNYPGKPGLNPILGVLFWLGLMMSFKHRQKYWLILFWALLSIVPSLFTQPNENPHFLRTYTLTVALIFLITLAINNLFKLKPNLKIWLILLILVSCVYEVRTYFKYQKIVFNQAFEKSTQDLKKLGIMNNRQK